MAASEAYLAGIILTVNGTDGLNEELMVGGVQAQRYQIHFVLQNSCIAAAAKDHNKLPESRNSLCRKMFNFKGQTVHVVFIHINHSIIVCF